MYGNPKFCLGTAQFGLDYGVNNQKGKPSERDAFEILDFASQNGIYDLDTADAYGDALDLLGRYFGRGGADFVIHSKFIVDGTPLRKKLSNTLRLLNRASISSYYFHNYSDYENHPSLRRKIAEIKDEGLIKNIGVSIYENKEFEAACEDESINIIQIPFNLLDNIYQRGSIINYANAQGKKLHIRSIFLQGLFFKNPIELPPKLSVLAPHLLEIKLIADNAGVSLIQLALNYALQCPGIEKVIVGVDTVEQLRQNLDYSNIVLPNSVMQSINNIRVEEVDLLYPKNW